MGLQLAVLIAKIILLILDGLSARDAAEQVATEAGFSGDRLLSRLPDRYK